MNHQTILGVQATGFTRNSAPIFLLGISYYAGTGSPNPFVQRDLDELQRRGFNWLRVFATWNAFDANISVVDNRGLLRKPFIGNLQRLVAECDRRGLIVDITLAREAGAAAGGVPNFAAHQKAVETLIGALKHHRNWYLDLANEHDVQDARYVPIEQLKALRDQVRRIAPPHLLVTASFGGHDLSEADLRECLHTIKLDFVSPHRPRNNESPNQTEAKTRAALATMKTIGRSAPIHYQEPFRRGYGAWQPSSADFLTDLSGAIAGGAAGWCLHNGSQNNAKDEMPRRSFDLRNRRLFDQLDPVERAVVAQAAPLVRRIVRPRRIATVG